MGDHTSEALVAAGSRARGRIRAKEPLVVCGLPLVERIYARLGAVTVAPEVPEGELVQAGRVLRGDQQGQVGEWRVGRAGHPPADDDRQRHE